MRRQGRYYDLPVPYEGSQNVVLVYEGYRLTSNLKLIQNAYPEQDLPAKGNCTDISFTEANRKRVSLPAMEMENPVLPADCGLKYTKTVAIEVDRKAPSRASLIAIHRFMFQNVLAVRVYLLDL
jgi:hypothetical protein